MPLVFCHIMANHSSPKMISNDHMPEIGIL
jgi:hypothetical protein